MRLRQGVAHLRGPVSRFIAKLATGILAASSSVEQSTKRRLVVRVDDRRSPTDLPPGPGGGWWNFGGLLREVYLRAVQGADLSQALVTPALQKNA